MGAWERGRMGAWENGRVGKWARGRKGARERRMRRGLFSDAQRLSIRAAFGGSSAVHGKHTRAAAALLGRAEAGGAFIVG